MTSKAPRPVERILVIQTAFLGDVILTTPLFSAIRSQHPQAEIDVIVIPATAEVLKGNPNLREIIIYNKHSNVDRMQTLKLLVRQVRARNYNLVLLAHRSLRSALIAYLAKIPDRVGFHNAPGRLLSNRVVFYDYKAHEIKRNLALVDWSGEVPPPKLYPSDKDREIAGKFLRSAGIEDGAPFFVVTPGAAWPTKRYPAAYFAQVIDRLWEEYGLPSVILGGKTDALVCSLVQSLTHYRPTLAAGELAILQSAAVIGRARFLLTNDSAPTHIGAAVGTRVATIYGPTVPGFGFYPWGADHLTIEMDLPCRPCSIHGTRRCKLPNHPCMYDLKPDIVINALAPFLEGLPRMTEVPPPPESPAPTTSPRRRKTRLPKND